jgi:hypothetical protein
MSSRSIPLAFRAHWTWVGLAGLAGIAVASFLAALWLSGPPRHAALADVAAGHGRSCPDGHDDGAYCPISPASPASPTAH